MGKLNSLLVTALFSITINAQLPKTIRIEVQSIGASVLTPNNAGSFDSGLERVWTIDGISYGGRSIAQNVNNLAQFKLESDKGVVYNTIAFPGKITNISMNTTSGSYFLYVGNTTRLINSTGAYDVVPAGTTLINTTAASSSPSWGATNFGSIDYTYFCIKKSSNGVGNINYIDVTYLDPSLAVNDITSDKKTTLVKNTVVSNEIIFGTAAKVSIYNTAGQLVKTADVSENTRMNVSDFLTGTYIVTALIDEKTVSQKIIKK